MSRSERLVGHRNRAYPTIPRPRFAGRSTVWDPGLRASAIAMHLLSSGPLYGVAVTLLTPRVLAVNLDGVGRESKGWHEHPMQITAKRVLRSGGSALKCQ